MNGMTEERLEEIRDLHARGVGDERWAVEERHKLVALVDPETVNSEIIYDLSGESNSYWNEKRPKAEFIAACPEIVADLLAEIRSLRGRLEAVCGVLSDAAAFGRVVEPDAILRAVRGE